MRVPKPPLLPEVAEYVEKTILDGLKRELDQEENVVRSLPFFATSMAALLALLGLTREPISKAEPGWLLGLVLLLGLLVAAALVRIIILMFRATKRQKQDQVMPEKQLVEFARLLEESYSDIENPKQRADTVRASLRRDITDQLAAYAQGLREINVYRLSLRAQMFTFLTVAVVCATLLISAIIVLEREERSRDEPHQQITREAVPVPGTATGQDQRQGPLPEGSSAGSSLPAQGTGPASPIDAGNRPLGSQDLPGQRLTPAPDDASVPTEGHSDP